MTLRGIFRNRALAALSLLLALEIVGFYAYPKGEVIPEYKPLRDVPMVAWPWQSTKDIPLDTDVAELLKADDTLNRYYVDNAGHTLSLFVALFKTQRSGVSPHSP